MNCLRFALCGFFLLSFRSNANSSNFANNRWKWDVASSLAAVCCLRTFVWHADWPVLERPAMLRWASERCWWPAAGLVQGSGDAVLPAQYAHIQQLASDVHGGRDVLAALFCDAPGTDAGVPHERVLEPPPEYLKRTPFQILS